MILSNKTVYVNDLSLGEEIYITRKIWPEKPGLKRVSVTKIAKKFIEVSNGQRFQVIRSFSNKYVGSEAKSPKNDYPNDHLIVIKLDDPCARHCV